MAAGGLVGILSKENRIRHISRNIGNCSVLAIATLFLVGLIGFDLSQIGAETVVIGEKTVDTSLPFSNTVLVLLMVTASIGVLVCRGNILESSKVVTLIGKRSYSLFVIHQIILAFYRYSISEEITAIFITAYLVLVFVLSEISYRFIEKTRLCKISVCVSLLSAVCLCLISGLLYINAGVVRDVPELNVYTSDVHRGMHAEYCDRVNSYNIDFSEDNGRLNVLVVGNSFARDWGNVLLESDYSDNINLSYSPTFDLAVEKRVNVADCLFVFMDKKDVPKYVWESERLSENIWAIGTKSFGSSNGIVYTRRFLPDYYDSSVELDDGYINLNDRWNNEWGNMYIDMIRPVRNTDGSIRVFTDDNMFISQDCKHLTEAGARYYARILAIGKYLGLKD